MESPQNEDTALVALLESGVVAGGWTGVANRVNAAGSAIAVWNTLTGNSDPRDDWGDEEVQPSLFPETPSAQNIEKLEESLGTACKLLHEWHEQGLVFLSVLNNHYPDQLREVYDMPPFLFAQGATPGREIGVSVVGSRKASPEGLDFAAQIARMLVRRGITVVAGGAAGIDAAAHRAALEVEGRTVAFLGTGITQRYPSQNRNLQDRIAREGGTLYSQFWPGQPPAKWTFPQRNASMSGFGIASVIVEAGEYSGTRIQARQAQAHGRPLIIRDTVVNTTKWAADMSHQSGVTVVHSIEDVEKALDRIQEQNRIISQLAKLA